MKKSLLASIVLVAVVTTLAAPVAVARPPEHAGPTCPPARADRTPQQVIDDHLASLATGDVDRIVCDYAHDAVVVMPGVVFTGRAQIRQGLLAMQGLFGATLPTITSNTVAGDTVLSTWRLETPHVVVEDGSDTFVVRGGRIQIQTVHAPLTFR